MASVRLFVTLVNLIDKSLPNKLSRRCGFTNLLINDTYSKNIEPEFMRKFVFEKNAGR